MVKISNRKTLLNFRKKLRTRSTSAEAELWMHLKAKKLNGRKFRRQHSIYNYIVDFYCPQEKLIIELDGDYHGEYYKIEEDLQRDRFLEDNGFRVIRIQNRFVFEDIDWVKEEIVKRFKS